MEKTIRNELRMDLLDGCMPIGEIESCLNHWRNKYEIVRKSELTQLKAENERLKAEIKRLQKCPDCNGEGIIIEAECCRLGEHQCCNQPNPIQVQCERCHATGLITNP